ncbi:MAG: DMT family transporter [Microscillaceae bacterium]|nr:DMT family transporter [Microscillaceae bacterium]
MPKKNTSLLTGGLIVFAGAILFSTKAIFVKLAYRYEVDAVSLLALRMLFSLPFFLVAAAWAGWGIPLHRRDVAYVALLGVLGYYAASILDFWGLQFINATLERLILFAYPTIVVVVSAWRTRTTIAQNQKIALSLTYLGILLAFWGDFKLSASPQMLWGSLLVFGAAIAYALYLVGSGAMIPRLGSVRFNALALTGASLGILLHAFLANGLNIFHFAPAVYWHSLGMALLATVAASFLISAGIGRIGAGNTAIISSIGPISTIVLASVFWMKPLGCIKFWGQCL